MNAGHPVSRSNRLPHVLEEAVDAIASQSAFLLAKERHATLLLAEQGKSFGPPGKGIT